MRELCYALFQCAPSSEPPFALELGFSDNSLFSIEGCEHIPDAVEKLESYCVTESAVRSEHFTLLYPIYLEGVDMHEVASLIREQAERKKWNFGRIGGYSGKTRDSFVPQGPAELFRGMTPESQRRVHLRLCEEALAAWQAYAAQHSPVQYRDSVVGMWHEVDVHLPYDALQSANAGADLANVDGRYSEPIVAVQDDDLEFPDSIEFAYFAIYNCFRRHARGEPIDPWLIVNQALSSSDDEASWVPRLAAAVKAAS